MIENSDTLIRSLERQNPEPFYMRAYAERADDGSLSFIASTEEEARDGLVIEANAWQLDNYQRNPVFLWVHDYMGDRPPIGRTEVTLDTTSKQLRTRVAFDPADEFAQTVERKYRDGFLNAVSVGWRTLEYQLPVGGKGPIRIKRADLLDVSAVPVPGDPGALIERQMKMIRAFISKDQLLEMAGVNGAGKETAESSFCVTEGEPVFRGIAIAMMDLFFAAGQIPDDIRGWHYNQLARMYRKFDREPPEFLSEDEMTALDDEERAALFFHGEPDLVASGRVGAVLSKKNKADLEGARELIAGVIERATIKPDEELAAIADEAQSEQEPDYTLLMEPLRNLERAFTGANTE